ncbi:hypothetical protein CCHL11_06056 [Colletotrichum chlorophyti]|uniref:Uncharacterized protein n=1 Tax=Colletotrichum chlorophyti TaxID=708187 RepID=A0A1Q8RWH6_9PEZI|nr:hypothetical protein CCHL11_06056 [Colletotrichum chlorophyti]
MESAEAWPEAPGWGEEQPAPAWGSDKFGDPKWKRFSEDDCRAAIRGEKVPDDLDMCPWVTQLCVLRGIRHNHGFATELRNMPGHPEFTRALNARQIMSNIIPEMIEAEEFPYCIWYPDVATEDTYRALNDRYPQMRYQIGRACAVAGYADFYKQLDILPEVSIAEEAREHQNNTGSKQIFDDIVRQHVRWAVMDDYTRSVNLENPTPARYGLNGDTALRSTLELKRMFEKPGYTSRFQDGKYRPVSEVLCGREPAPFYFNITEDWNIDEFESTLDDTRDDFPKVRAVEDTNTSEMLELLWNPLPRDLPEGNKDILILMAAYHGDVDRYQRLRRPGHFLSKEPVCVIRGIYHNTLFARWCSSQPELQEDYRYQAAVNARFIMNNDVSRINEDTHHWALPYQIWYPGRASGATYLELARRRPEMKEAAARACIVAGYKNEWDQLDVEPSRELFAEAKASVNPHYLADLRRRCADRGLEEFQTHDPTQPSRLVHHTSNYLAEPSASCVSSSVSTEDIHEGFESYGIYNGSTVNASTINLFASVPEHLRPTDNYSLDLEELYYEIGNQPPSEEEAHSRAWRPSHLRYGHGAGKRVPWGHRGWDARTK